MQTYQAEPKASQEPLYPIRLLSESEYMTGRLLYSFGRLFLEGDDGHWYLVDEVDAE